MEKLNEFLIEEIKSKKQIEFLDDNYILEKIEKFFLTNGDLRKKLEKEFEKNSSKINKNKIFKEVVKKIREEIGIVYGSFLTKEFSKKEKVLERITSQEEVLALLVLHKSTRERIDYYDEIYSRIFNWYEPEYLADLACGLNPASYFLLPKKVKYFASDLNKNDMEFLNSFFNRFEIEGVAKNYDIVNLEILKDKELQNADLVFLFKALDSFETIKKNISKELLEQLPQKKIVVSFPTKSLVSKQEFKLEKRNWLFNFLEKKNWEYEIFEVENELFILISKN